jgi:phosphoribosylformylglycinamidine (FGAM) synthase PurS component
MIGVVMRSEVVRPQNNPTLQWALDEMITARTLLRGLHRRGHLEVERVETGRAFPINLLSSHRTRTLLKDKKCTWSRLEAKRPLPVVFIPGLLAGIDWSEVKDLIRDLVPRSGKSSRTIDSMGHEPRIVVLTCPTARKHEV